MKKIIKSIFQYLGAFVLSLVIAIALRFFVVDFYKIPSDSMSPAIEPGDFIVVNKLYFGARFYKSIHFTEDTPLETIRIPGYSSLKRNDVIVFNFPMYGEHDEWEIDPETFYVKRCIALPGDTLSIVEGTYQVNQESGYGNTREQRRLHHFQGEYASKTYNTFPFNDHFHWTIQNFGPLPIPASGQTLPIDTLNYILYKNIIAHETCIHPKAKQGKIYLGDSIITHYTFKKNWYFIAGDQVFNSQDSRYIGPIPEDFIVGKASFILTSKDPYTQSYAWNRFFKAIK